MLVAALAFNLIVLIPVISGLISSSSGSDAAFGPATDARAILTCIYAAIAMVSAGLIWLHLTGQAWAVPMTLALFAVQISYKMATLYAVGLSSPVVIANLVVVGVQIAALAFWRYS